MIASECSFEVYGTQKIPLAIIKNIIEIGNKDSKIK